MSGAVGIFRRRGRVGQRDAGDASTSASAGALSIVDSTEDVFAAFCESQVELVARALGRGARCMLYLRSPGTAGDSLQLEEVASFPPSSRWDDDGEGVRDGDGAVPFISPSSFGTAASSFADSLGESAAGPSKPPLGSGSITLSGGGSVDDADGPMTAAEALLVKQRVFALPSTNALVVPLSRDAQLLGLIVGEMPEGGGWRKNRVSARTRKERERRATRDGDAPEVEVLSAAAGEEEEREARDTAAQFGDRRQAALSAAARSIVAAWSMRLRAEYATAAAVRSDRRVAGFTYAAKEPLSVLRTLGGMLTSHLKPDTPSRDMADAMMARGACSPACPRARVRAVPARDGGRARREHGRRKSRVDDAAAAARRFPRGSGRGNSRARRVQDGLGLGLDDVDRAYTRDDGDDRGDRVRPRALVRRGAHRRGSPRVRGGDGETVGRDDDGDVSRTGRAKNFRPRRSPRRSGDARARHRRRARRRAKRRRRGRRPSHERERRGGGDHGDGGEGNAGGGTRRGESPGGRSRRRRTSATRSRADRWRKQSLKIARSIVESAGGVFHVLPSLPPTVGRVELWIPAAAESRAGAGGASDDDAAEEEDAVDV